MAAPADHHAQQGTPPLGGRERELAALHEALAAALAGRGSLVLIGGEAGIGKTTLVGMLRVEARDDGAPAQRSDPSARTDFSAAIGRHSGRSRPGPTVSPAPRWATTRRCGTDPRIGGRWRGGGG